MIDLASRLNPRQIKEAESQRYDEIWRIFGQLQMRRNVFAGHWEEVAELVLPTSRNTFFYGSYNTMGEKKTQHQIDATGMMALHRFAAICDSLLTPRNMMWHGLAANSEYIMKDRATRVWFEKATRALFKYRYSPNSNFSSQNNNVYISLGAFGNAGMFIDHFDGPQLGLRYKNIPLGELYFFENHQGVVDGFVRWFRLTARQARQKWGEDKLPDTLWPALQMGSETPFDFLHFVAPQDDYDPGRLDVKGKPYQSCYVSVQGKCVMQEGGYHSFPLPCSRYEQTPGETYGRGPAMMVLPALKTLNAEKRTFLKQGHRAADPVLLLADDGLLNMSLRPGATNVGGWSAEGKPLVGVLPTGEIQITKEMMAEEKSLIQDAFLVTLFQILTETPTMTATEVIERTNEKGILLAPTVGRQQSEYLGRMIDRELDVLMQQRLLEPMPPRLLEANGEYQVVYTAPLSRAMRAQESAGFMRTVESVKELVNITGNPALLDPFNFDVAIPEIAEQQAVPITWMATDEEIADKRKARAQQQQIDQKIKAMPAEAAMVKAQAVATKNQPQVGIPSAMGG